MGNLNVKFMVIGAAFVLLMVLFGGHKHVDPATRKREAALAAGKDPLVEAIQAHNNPKGGFMGGVGSMLGKGVGSGSSGSSGVFSGQSSGVVRSNGQAISQTNNDYSHSGLVPNANAPSSPGYNRQQPVYGQEPQATVPVQNGYYPPPPLPDGAAR